MKTYNITTSNGFSKTEVQHIHAALERISTTGEAGFDKEKDKLSEAFNFHQTREGSVYWLMIADRVGEFEPTHGEEQDNG